MSGKKKSTSALQLSMDFNRSGLETADGELGLPFESDNLVGQISEILDHFEGESSLKRLFWEVLSYNRVRESLPTSFLPASMHGRTGSLEVFAETQSITVVYMTCLNRLDRAHVY